MVAHTADKIETSTPRVRYATAAAAQREAMSRLQRVPVTAKKFSWWRVASYLVTAVGSYSRVSGAINKRAVAAACGVSDDTVGRAIDWAVRHDVFTWSPGVPGGCWVLTLPDPSADSGAMCGGVAASDDVPSAEGGSADPRSSYGDTEKAVEKTGGAPNPQRDDGDVPEGVDEFLLWLERGGGLSNDEALTDDAGLLALHAAEALGCSLDRWLDEVPRGKARRLERLLRERLAAGESWSDLLAALVRRPPPLSVDSFAGLMLARASGPRLAAAA